MISKPWRERLTYTAMSVFVAWHAAATIFAPAPQNSVIAIALRPVSITFTEHQHSDFAAEDHLSGKLPTDPEFVTEQVVKRVPCPNS